MPLPDVAVNRSSPVPLYFQLAEQIEGAIQNGQLAPGDRIANEVALADRLGLSRPTVRQAIQTLADKGLLVRKRGVGTQVVSAPNRRTVELTSLYDDLTRNGLSPTTSVLRLDLVAPDEVARQRLNIGAGERVWRVDRLRRAKGEPLALMCNVVPASVTDLSLVDLEQAGLYEHFRTVGIHLRVAHQVIGARIVDTREAKLLGGRKGDPVLTMERTSYDDQGRPVEYGLHLYRPDRYAYETTLVDR
ncbi:MAG TPA: GntR family transcriptional regulator [Nocardioides sp.]|nr:GntR family transcriptional regulator [Nocardioides sp.]